MASVASAASLRYGAVESTENNVIEKYRSRYTSENSAEKVIYYETNQLSVDLNTIGLVDGVTYSCDVAAINTNGYVGPFSKQVKYNSEWPFPGATGDPAIYISFELKPAEADE